MAFKTIAVLLALAAPCSGMIVVKNSTAVAVNANTMVDAFASMKLDPFSSAPDACDYCFGSYTKTGDKPAGPVAPFCICMSYPSGSGHLPFCATPPSAAGYIKDKGGCRCKARDMEAMGSTTCQPFE
mmetsp:Transcript_17560/g.38694  ORF Transcript_17560/g.38694 Transcript_17560/m.38694 type:complete len:127 (-) Transcript_17560:61-441(-)